LDENSDPVFVEAMSRDWLNSSLESGDWESSAEIVEKLSLVVTIDTAMAHLCGALGVPCVVLLNNPADWRWGQAGVDCFLYSSVRLARCPRAGAWQEALEIAGNHVANFLDKGCFL
jgi:ADP-heptose:LPS heptosyltransferase